MIRHASTRANQWWNVVGDDNEPLVDGDVPDPWAGCLDIDVQLSSDQRSFLLGDLDQPALNRLRDVLWSPGSDPGQLNEFISESPVVAGDATGNPPGDSDGSSSYGS
jgi:hypothetical protein